MTQPKTNKDQTLFTIRVTKTWITQFVIALVLNCHANFRGVMKTLMDMFNYPISLGSIHNILQEAITKAKEINQKQEIERIKIGAQDELFHANKPVLAGIDIESLYCYLLAAETDRSGDTWAIYMMYLQDQSFNPDCILVDQGSGLKQGISIAFPETELRGDVFHISKQMQELNGYFKNRLKGSATKVNELIVKMKTAKTKKIGNRYSKKLAVATKKHESMKLLSSSISILVGWMMQDVLAVAGPTLKDRYYLYDFIVSEFESLESITAHRVRAVRKSLQNQKESLLQFAKTLNSRLSHIASHYKVSSESVFDLCKLERYSKSNSTYFQKEQVIRKQFGNRFFQIQKSVQDIMANTYRSSSLVENFNSRLRPYFFLRQHIGNGYLDLLQFYLNHTPFLRSRNPNRVGKSPAQLLSGQHHPHWLEMLGFKTPLLNLA